MFLVGAGLVNDAKQKYIAVSRIGRFGKVLDADMIVAFFEKNTMENSSKNLRYQAMKIFSPITKASIMSKRDQTKLRKLDREERYDV